MFRTYPGIYKITNLVNNKCYFGQTNNIKTRLSGHKSQLRGNYSPHEHLQRAFNKYTEDNFLFEVICYEDDPEILDELEIEYINLFNTLDKNYGYNKKPGGTKYKYHIDETRELISKNNARYWLGKTQSKESSIRKSKSMKGKNTVIGWKNPEHSEKMKGNQYNRNKKIDDDKDIIINLYNSGLSFQKIADKYNVSGHTIGNRFREWNIKPRC
jgi:group I intron endonuclease